MRTEQAELTGFKALSHLAASPDEIEGFLRETGVSPSDLGKSADNPELLGAVLAFLLQSDDRLIAFCEAQDCSPEEVQRASYALPGGEVPWE